MPSITHILQTLTQARDLINNKDNWCHNYLLRTYDGLSQMCARGAILNIVNGSLNRDTTDDLPYCEELAKDIPSNFVFEKFLIEPPTASMLVARYNNRVSHEKVIALFDATIARLKRQQVIDDLAEISVDKVAETV